MQIFRFRASIIFTFICNHNKSILRVIFKVTANLMAERKKQKGIPTDNTCFFCAAFFSSRSQLIEYQSFSTFKLKVKRKKKSCNCEMYITSLIRVPLDNCRNQDGRKSRFDLWQTEKSGHYSYFRQLKNRSHSENVCIHRCSYSVDRGAERKCIVCNRVSTILLMYRGVLILGRGRDCDPISHILVLALEFHRLANYFQNNYVLNMTAVTIANSFLFQQ